MALMIPSVLPKNPPPGEREVFARLRDDPDTKDWIVLHSLDIARHPTQVSGEADFIVLVPRLGALVLEVKSHTHIHRGEDGLWYFGKDVAGEARGPFRQAADAMHALRNHVVEKRPDLAGVVFWSAVILPFASGRIVTGEWHPWQMVDSAKFRASPINRIVSTVLVRARELLSTRTARWFAEDEAPSIEQCRTITSLLRPKFEVFQSPAARARLLAQELRAYTEEQLEFLDSIELNPRLVLHGPAGTGKTLLAVESARRSINQGRRTALLCFNRLLSQRLTEETKTLPGLTCASMHKLMCDIAQVRPPDNCGPEWWASQLPQLATEALLARDAAARFDEIVLDEFQDFLLPSLLDFLDLIVEGGLAAGRWRAFGDFERQSIYQTPDHITLTEFLEKRSGRATTFNLTVNCRNLPRVVHHVHRLGQLVPGYRRIRRPDDGVDPEFHFYRVADEQLGMLRRALLKLDGDGFQPADIVVLSPLRNCAAARLADAADGPRIVAFSDKEKSVRWTTIQAFKGLEAPAVILTDIQDVSSPDARDLFYIGLTRTVQRLVICASNSVAADLLSLLQKS